MVPSKGIKIKLGYAVAKRDDQTARWQVSANDVRCAGLAGGDAASPMKEEFVFSLGSHS